MTILKAEVWLTTGYSVNGSLLSSGTLEAGAGRRYQQDCLLEPSFGERKQCLRLDLLRVPVFRLSSQPAVRELSAIYSGLLEVRDRSKVGLWACS